jgi:hypothetical protein
VLNAPDSELSVGLFTNSPSRALLDPLMEHSLLVEGLLYLAQGRIKL